METCDFGLSSDEPGPFVLGVIYDDKDRDNEYDPGEGLGSLTVEITGPITSTTTTASAGGFAIPVHTPGEYSINVLQNGNVMATSTFSISNQNVKIDFTVSDDDTSGGTGGDTGSNPDAIDPPTQKEIGMWPDPATAPLHTDASGNLEITFHYTDEVDILAGFMDEDFNIIETVNASCNTINGFTFASRITDMECSGITIPANTYIIFWLVTETPISSLDWVNDPYQLFFYAP
jgi:hypothetical protein